MLFSNSAKLADLITFHSNRNCVNFLTHSIGSQHRKILTAVPNKHAFIVLIAYGNYEIAKDC